MDCLEFRRRLGAEPHVRDPEGLAHRDDCAACRAAWERAQSFEHALQGALDVPVPEGLAERVLLAQATGQRQHAVRRHRVALALAASLLLALGVGGYGWRQLDAHSLPALAVAHMPGEIHSLDLVQPIAAPAIAAGFADRGVSLHGPAPADVTYVHDCPVGPYKTVHLVSRVDGTPVAVLYLPHKQVAKASDFHRGSWHGRIVPLQHGTLVMLTDRGGAPHFDAVAQGWRMAIDGVGGAQIAGSGAVDGEPGRLAP
ncbi:DUF3379 family protein [Rhodanobacter sp. B2A1Ga4]|uniref:DUF3379 family protein n=1 Tax=Rhodanobacter TaxID=75309 RepID=UPI00131F212D|nr:MULTISPECIES: DUF3379 family protein [Rhodanobacter]MBQ4855134.1 DUF3379 family protein [Rhodanobacter sp. B2A1Ga4]